MGTVAWDELGQLPGGSWAHQPGRDCFEHNFQNPDVLPNREPMAGPPALVIQSGRNQATDTSPPPPGWAPVGLGLGAHSWPEYFVLPGGQGWAGRGGAALPVSSISLLDRVAWNFLLVTALEERTVSGLTHASVQCAPQWPQRACELFAIAVPAYLLLSRWYPAFRNPPGSPFHLPPLGKPLPSPISSAHTQGLGCGGWWICILGCGILAKSFYLSEPQLYACMCREPSCGSDGQPRSMFCASTKKFLRLFLKVWALVGILLFLSCWMRKGLDFRSV